MSKKKELKIDELEADVLLSCLDGYHNNIDDEEDQERLQRLMDRITKMFPALGYAEDKNVNEVDELFEAMKNTLEDLQSQKAVKQITKTLIKKETNYIGKNWKSSKEVKLAVIARLESFYEV